MKTNNDVFPPIRFDYKKISAPYFLFLVFTASLYTGLFYCVFHAELFAFLTISFLLNLLIVGYLRYGYSFQQNIQTVFFFLLGKTFLETFFYFAIGFIFYQVFGRFPFTPIIMLLYLFIFRYTISDIIKYFLFDGLSLYKSIQKSYQVEYKSKKEKKRFIKFSGTILGVLLFVGTFLLKEKTSQYLPTILGISISFLILFFFEPVTKREERGAKKKK